MSQNPPPDSATGPGRRTKSPLRSRLVRARILQAVLLLAFWQLGEWISWQCHLPIPGAITALFVVLALLGLGWLPLQKIHHGASWFIGEMLLFFVPPLLALLDYPQFFGLLGLKLLVAIVAGTLIVMTATALTVELCSRFMTTRREGCHD